MGDGCRVERTGHSVPGDFAQKWRDPEIRQRRAQFGLSQEGLALDAGIDRTFVSQIERGVGNPSLRILCRIADRLELPVYELLYPSSP